MPPCMFKGMNNEYATMHVQMVLLRLLQHSQFTQMCADYQEIVYDFGIFHKGVSAKWS